MVHVFNRIAMANGNGRTTLLLQTISTNANY